MSGLGLFIRANVIQTLKRFHLLLMAFGFGVVLLLVSATLAGSVISDTAMRLDESSELSAMELLSVSPAGEPRQLTRGALDEIRALPGVERVTGAASVGAVMEQLPETAAPGLEDAFDGVYWLMPRFPWSQPPLMDTLDGGFEAELRPGQVLMPSTSMGVDMRGIVGSTVDVEFTRRVDQGQGAPETTRLTVVGLYDVKSPRMAGEGAAYVAQEDFELVFGALLGAPRGVLPADVVFPKAWVKVANVEQAHAVARQLTEAGFYIQSGGGVESLAPALSTLRQANGIGLVVLLLFGLGIGASLSGTWVQLRRWDVGLLTSLGWTPGLILRAYAAELALVGLAVGFSASVVAGGISVAASLLLRGKTLLGMEIGDGAVAFPWMWLALQVLGIPLVFVLGALPKLGRLIQTPPDDALRRPD